jgi:hypothetical protein
MVREMAHIHAQAEHEQESREAAEVLHSVCKVKYTETSKQANGTFDNLADVYSASDDDDADDDTSDPE